MTAMTWQNAAAIAFPFRNPADETGKARALRWWLHVLLWSSVLASLWYVNRWCDLERTLRSPWPLAHRAWLPILGLALYLIGWLSVGLWNSLRRVPGVAWPDVAAAWDAARPLLTRANVDVTRAPLFLIVGPLPCELQTPLESLGATELPASADAPFRILAHPRAIYVVCDRLARIVGQASAEPKYGSPTRMQYLCQLLVRDRAPRVAIEGLVLIVPFAALQSDSDTRKAALACQNDVREIRHATGLEVPLFLAISDLDPLPTGASAEPQQPWFQHFPPVPDLDPAEISSMYRKGVDSLCLTQIRNDATARLRVDHGKTDGLTAALCDNIRLHQWLASIETWRTRLSKLLVEGTQNDASEPGLVAGCYLAPRGLAQATAVELARTLCADLLAQRDIVTWSADALARQARDRRMARLGFAAGAVGLAILVGAMGLFVSARL